MDKELKAKWVEALRSGSYKQATTYLYDSHDGGFCCLGVLGCVLGIPSKAMEGASEITTMPYRFVYDAGVSEDTARKLAMEMNDSGVPFAQIADYIEANL